MHVHCRWVDSKGNQKYEAFILEVEILLLIHCQASQRESNSQGDQLTRVLCITNSVAKYGNGLPIFVVCTGIIHLRVKL